MYHSHNDSLHKLRTKPNYYVSQPQQPSSQIKNKNYVQFIYRLSNDYKFQCTN
jgi:hypothetical protein